jgi:hypothetical protein
MLSIWASPDKYSLMQGIPPVFQLRVWTTICQSSVDVLLNSESPVTHDKKYESSILEYFA